jgi:Transglycosylase SLT domain
VSGSIATIPLAGVPVNPWTGIKDYNSAIASQFQPAQAEATVGLTGAQTKEAGARAELSHQQAIAAALANRYQGAWQSNILGALSGSSYGGSADDVLANGGNMPQPAGQAAPAGGGYMPSAVAAPAGGGAIGQYATTSDTSTAPAPGPVGSAPLPGPAIGNTNPRMSAPAPVMPGGGAIGQAGGGGGQMVAQAAPQRPFTGSGGSMVPGMGVPLPTMWLRGIYAPGQQNPVGELNKAIEGRNLLLRQRIMQTMDAQGRVDPDAWNLAVKQSFNDGLITNQDLMRFYNHPQLGQSFLQGTMAPQDTAMQKGLAAGAEAQAQVGPHVAEAGGKEAVQAPYRAPVTIKVPTGQVDKNGQMIYEDRQISPADLPAALRPNAPAYTPYRVQQALVGTEQSGPNAVSPAGARGTAQIQPDTFKRYALPGESFNNEDDRVRAAGRFVDDLWRQYPNDPARVAVGYFSGPGNISAPGSPTPWKENKSDHNLTTSQYVQRFMGKLSGGLAPAAGDTTTAAPTVPPGGTAPAAPAGGGGGAAPAPAAPEGGTGPVPGAAGGPSPAASIGVPGGPALTPQQQADLEVSKRQQLADIEQAKEVGTHQAQTNIDISAIQQKALNGEYGDQSKAIVATAQGVPTKLQRLDELTNAAAEFRTGATAELRKAALSKMVDAIQLMGGKVPDFMMKGITGAEVIEKEGGFLAAEMTRMLGSREAASIFNQIKAIQPGLHMSTGGFEAILSSIRQGVLRDRDLNAFQEQWLSNPANNNSIGPSAGHSGMMDAFNAQHPIEQYASRVVPYPLPKQQTALKPDVIYRAPNGSVARWDGQMFQPVGQ